MNKQVDSVSGGEPRQHVQSGPWLGRKVFLGLSLTAVLCVLAGVSGSVFAQQALRAQSAAEKMPTARMPVSTPSATPPNVSATPMPASGNANKTPAVVPPAASIAPVQAVLPRGRVQRSSFTTAVVNREPVDTLRTVPNSVHTVYYFTELRGLSGQTVIHRWEYKGTVMAAVHFKVRGPRWRVWSSKNIRPDQTGQWKVFVINGSGQAIAEDAFNYVTAPPHKAMPAPMPMSAPSHKAMPAPVPMPAPPHKAMPAPMPMSAPSHKAMPAPMPMPAPQHKTMPVPAPMPAPQQ